MASGSVADVKGDLRTRKVEGRAPAGDGEPHRPAVERGVLRVLPGEHLAAVEQHVQLPLLVVVDIEYIAAARLALENAGVNPDDYLREQGFNEEIVEAVLSVTRREGESYDEHVRRAAANELGRMVKRADLEDNMDVRRYTELTDSDVERLRKYLRAWQYLLN